MTKATKEQILNTWQLIGKLRQALEKDMAKYIGEPVAEFMDLLGQYQGAVIEIGNLIEKTTNQKVQDEIIPMLEDYCEAIFSLSQKTVSLQEMRSALIALREKHRKIETEIGAVETKKLALFLPYKYSMWDALESIYLATMADPEWEAVVMPIPYTEREKDGAAKGWQCERQLYKDVETVDFGTYRIADHRPDVVYLHNPYDGYNTVTSVAPEYYTTELKKYCGKLIYVPYFFTGEVFPDAHLAIPPYENMDYIILPSEYSKNQMKKYVPEKKLLVLGSPKVDRTMRLKEEKIELPAEWERRLRGKRAVLYNIGINALLHDGFNCILKMRYVFNYFKRHPEVVLWWRPHPLLKATLQSMRPAILDAYEEMERSFICEKIGIYDTTADSNRAIAATDGFIGDYSSMCTLYGIMGKPIFRLENRSVEEPESGDRKQIWIQPPAMEPKVQSWSEWPVWDKDGYTYFYNAQYKILCKINRDMEDIQVVHTFEQSMCNVVVLDVDDSDKMRICMVPGDDHYAVMSYHIQSGELKEEKVLSGHNLVEQGGLLDYGNYYVALPGKNPQFLYIDKQTGACEYHGDYETSLRSYSEYPDEHLFVSGFRVEDSVYLCSTRVGKMVEYNLRTHQHVIYDIGDGKDRFSGFCYAKEEFYLFAWDGTKIVRWNKNQGVVRIYDQMPQGFFPRLSVFAGPQTPAFAGGGLMMGKLVVWPFLANMILQIDLESGEIREWELDLPYVEGQRKTSLYNNPNNYAAIWGYAKGKLIMQSSFDGSLLDIDLETNQLVRKKCELSDTLFEQYKTPMDKVAQRKNRHPYMFYENGLQCTLSDMMVYFATTDSFEEERQHEASTEGIANPDGDCGQKVHEYISRVI